jgi:cytochrome d ubiquinol oxidase subunit II
MFDYETLRLIWWLLLGVLLIGFAVMDGFDLGAAMLLPFVARTDSERRVVVNAIGPFWEGNQVWLILGGGAIFAAWPTLYAVAFSGFYLAMFLVLVALILRPVSFKFRSKIDNPRWHSLWDWALFISGLVPALIFGVAFGNVLRGVPFRLDDALRMTYAGNLLGLLNPFALLCGLISSTMLIMHGGAYLALKADSVVADRAAAAARIAAMVLIGLFIVGGLSVAFPISGYRITSDLVRGGPSNPLFKTVTTGGGFWLSNYTQYPLTLLAPALVFVSAGLTAFLVRGRRNGFAIIASGIAVAGVIATAGLSAFPFLLPSSLDPNVSLTVWDASSSRLTLFVMLIVTAILLPIVLAYTAFAYRVLRGRVTLNFIEKNSSSIY